MRNDLPRPGDVLAGKYRVRSVLGRGRGMLYEGEHTAFEQRVAIRVVSPQIADDVEVSKFRREARALAKLGSEHVARILDVGVLPDGSFYLVRQYLEGQDLSSYLKQRRQLPIDEAVGWILQATEAVAETHAYGILLRELSPDQLFLAERSPGVRGGPRVLKIIDFGTAKLLRESQPGAVEDYTATTVMGLSPYSSPEMVRRQRDIDVRTDVWSLGAILYEMLAGQPPFGSDALSLAISITRDEPVPLTRFRRDVPVELETAIRCTLMKDRNSRLADTHAFAAALARFAPPEGRVLMERIRDLASSARARLGGESDDEMEISDVEEIDDEATGDADDVATRVGHVSEIGGAPRTAAFPARGGPVLAGAAAPSPQSPAKTAPVPRRSVTQEKTEALGFNFIPSDPMLLGLGKDSAPPPRADNAPKPTQLLPVVQGPAPSFGPPKTTPPPPPAPPAPPSAPTNPYDRGSHAPASSSMGAQPMGPMAAQPMGVAQASSFGPAPSPSGAGDAQAMAKSARDVPAWMHTAGPQAGLPVASNSATSNNNARTRKIAMIAIGGGLVALLAMVVFIIVLPSSGGSSASASATTEPTATAATTSTAATTTTPTATTEPTTTPPATSDPVATSEPVATATAEPKSTSAATTAKPKATGAATATATPTATAKPTATATATSEPPKSGDQGTLVLVATGGTCAFSVNGQAKGTTNSMKLSVPAGSYAVTCKPASGSSKSKSVQVKSGGTAMAMFKL